jgi:hypothetical protein
VANLASVPTSSTATGSCAGTVTFANASGTAIGSPAKFAVPAGQIFSVPLPFTSSGYSSRGEILASVQQTLTIPSSIACSLSISLEIFDTSTGVTHAVVTTAVATAEPIAVLLPGPIQ